jgi:hypothetical protein
MMSMAAIKALAQLLSSPSFWEKTVHGLDGRMPDNIRAIGRVPEISPAAELERPAA